MPAHHVDLLTGIGPWGAIIEGRRRKPVVGSSNWFVMVSPRLFAVEVVLGRFIAAVAEVGLAITDFGFSFSVR
jgi:hypothetical protein